MDMSPFSTLMNCGNSSRLVRRMKAPKGVAFLALPAPPHCTPFFSMSTGIERNFNIMNGLPFQLTRSCR